MGDRALKSLFLEQAVKDCVVALNKDKKVGSATTSAGHLLGNIVDLYQVQVIVTRNEDEFMDDLEVVVFNK